MSDHNLYNGDYQVKIRANVTIDPETGCWLWNRARNNLGYGFIHYKGKSNQLAHRVSYFEFKGAIPTGHCVRHKCDNPACCNPDHLSTGTKLDNTTDMVSRGRNLATIKAMKRTGKSNKHRRWYNDGTQSRRILIGDPIPEGFEPGVYKKAA